tara:strand:+ start:537 stop:1166 length:630 start_codon:yes stop_codon:yes gene_type:complete
MNYSTQNDLILNKLKDFYNIDNNLDKMLKIINGETSISLRIVDWFVTNYCKNNYIVYIVDNKRFKVYDNYKLQLKSYSKRRFDPFCRWDRISVNIKDDILVLTTIGQLNFFKWALENKVIEYIENNYKVIDIDMNLRNSYAKKKLYNSSISSNSSSSSNSSNTSNISVNTCDNNTSSNNKITRKKREELSINISKSIKKEVFNSTDLFN